jgi:Cof subfamily protein (haloacid dehalogenase superfamily)/beta-phosphoglucomutase family hydrolase
MKAVRLVVSDFDGTLLTPERTITARSCAAVARLRDAGIHFTITSSRAPRGLARVTEQLQLVHPIAPFNGGLFVQPDLTTVLTQHTLPLAVSAEVVAYLLEAGLDVWVYRGADWFVRDPAAPHVAHEQATGGFAATVIADLPRVLDGAVKIVGVSDDAARVAGCEAELRRRVGDHVSAARSQTYYLDVTHPEANKGAAVRFLAQLIGVPLDAVATIGDMPNDVLMFGLAGTSIAMGNASLDVQRAARHVTSANDAEGFAHAVERFVLATGRAAPTTLGLPASTRACLFDLDGVLTQTAKLHASAWKEMFDEFLRERAAATGEPFVPFDGVHDYTVYVDGKLRVDGARAFLGSRGIRVSDAEIEALASRKDERLVALMRREHVATYDGSVRYVHAARDAGLRTAVVSASKHCGEALASAGIAGLFDVRIDGNVAAAEHLAGKPAPDSYLAAARAVGVTPAEAVIFEDALAGVEAGRAGHFGYVVGVDRVGQAAELRRHGADVVVTDLAALLESP